MVLFLEKADFLFTPQLLVLVVVVVVIASIITLLIELFVYIMDDSLRNI